MPEDVKNRIDFLQKEYNTLAKKFNEQRRRPYNDLTKGIKVWKEREQKMMEYLAEIDAPKEEVFINNAVYLQFILHISDIWLMISCIHIYKLSLQHF